MDGAVLVIHDEQALRAAARQALLQVGRQVAEAAEIAAALQIAERLRPAVIVLPWLGRRPAREALAQLRDTDATRRSRLIVWAEHSDMPNAVAALEFGADDCLALPFEPSELVARVNACLRRPLAAVRPDQLSGRSARPRQSRAPSAGARPRGRVLAGGIPFARIPAREPRPSLQPRRAVARRVAEKHHGRRPHRRRARAPATPAARAIPLRRHHPNRSQLRLSARPADVGAARRRTGRRRSPAHTAVTNPQPQIHFP